MWRQWIVPCVLTAMCVAGFTVLTLSLGNDDPQPAPSGCYAVTADKKSLGLAEADCAAYNATYKVALTVESSGWSTSPAACPEGPYRALRHGFRDDTRCMTLNVQVGDCLQHARARRWAKTDARGELARNHCGPAAEVKVTKIVTGPRESCGPGEKTNYYSQSSLTVCLGKP